MNFDGCVIYKILDMRFQGRIFDFYVSKSVKKLLIVLF